MNRATARLGESASLLRKIMYRTMALPEPGDAAAFDPIPDPPPRSSSATAHLIGAHVDRDVVTLRRVAVFAPLGPLSHRHVAADVQHASFTELDGAAVLYVNGLDPANVLRQWPNASLAAVTQDARTCLVHDTNGTAYTVAADADLPDPRLLASLVHVRLMRGETPTRPETLRLGTRRVGVRTATAQTRRDSGVPSGGP